MKIHFSSFLAKCNHIIFSPKKLYLMILEAKLLSVMEIGTKAYETLRKEHFVEKFVRFSSTIHQTNLNTFLSIHKHEKKIKESYLEQRKKTSKSDAQLRSLVPEEGLWRKYFSMTFPLPHTCLIKI